MWLKKHKYEILYGFYISLNDLLDSILHIKLSVCIFITYFVDVFKNGSMKLKIHKKYNKPHYTGKKCTFRIIELCIYSSHKLL